MELRPRRADAFAVARVDVHLVAVDLEHEVGHKAVQIIGRQRGAALDALVDLELKARERGHDEEVAVEVGHRLFDHRELQRRVGGRGQQVTAGQRLVHVRRHLGLEQPVVGVHVRLRSARVVGVHRVPELVSQGAHRVDVVVVAHEDEGPRVHGAGGEGAHALALVGIDVDPPLIARSPAQHFHVLLTQRSDTLCDPVDRLLVGHLQHLLAQLRARVVGLQHL